MRAAFSGVVWCGQNAILLKRIIETDTILRLLAEFWD